MPELDALGGYALVRLLGRGGMAEVWEARPPGEGGGRVAVKTLAVHDTGDRALARRLLDEARVGASLVHPHLVRTLDVVQERDRVGIVMELIDGVTLAELARPDQVPPLGWTVAVALQVLDGLGYLHDARGPDGAPLFLVHRDLKPSNVLVTRAGAVKIIDFGIASLQGLDRTRTRTGVLRGSLPYCSPEMLGHAALDARSDLFSFGLLLYELLCGVRCFSQPTEAGILSAVLWAPVLAVSQRRPGIPPALDALVSRLLEKERDKRPASAKEARALLEAALPSSERFTPSQVAGWMKTAALRRAVNAETASGLELDPASGAEPDRPREAEGTSGLTEGMRRPPSLAGAPPSGADLHRPSEPEGTPSRLELHSPSLAGALPSRADLHRPSEPERTPSRLELHSPSLAGAPAGVADLHRTSEPEGTPSRLELHRPSEPEGTPSRLELRSPSLAGAPPSRAELHRPSEPEGTPSRLELRSPSLAGAPPSRAGTRVRGWLLGALGLALAGGLVFVGAWLGSRGPAAAPPLVSRASAPAPPAPPKAPRAEPTEVTVAPPAPVEPKRAPKSSVRTAAKTRAPGAAEPGWLTVGVTSGWVQVEVDGRSLGPTPLFRQPLPAGKHALVATRPDGTRQRLTVVIEPGKERKVIVDRQN